MGGAVYVRSYFNTWNLGDAVQTVALSRLLPSVEAWPASGADNRPLVVNGWLGREPIYPAHAIYAGVFVSPRMPDHYHAIGMAAQRRPIGCRDPFTVASLWGRGIAADLVGCATLTLPHYDGPRSGELHVDDDTPGCLTNYIPSGTSWANQWALAIERLGQLERAEHVTTTRLHVLLPCLAFGTPVTWRAAGGEARERFSLLDAMGVRPGRVEYFDVGPWACRYRSFLSDALGIELEEREPTLP